ncbi:MAG: hypothetical protein LBS00_10835 [Synergistaceae bacterium]|jgi:ATP-dependent DNA helicase RecG|nr:hypothetical protein [Synergistaceae bacterium]
MTVSNGNRAERDGPITPENCEPTPKNPIISAFFRTIGLAEELGFGVKNLFKYGRRYSGQDPQLIDGDIFRIIVPLDDSYSFDAEMNKTQINHGNFEKDFEINETQRRIVDLIAKNPKTTAEHIMEIIGITRRQAESNIHELKLRGILKREGGRRYGRWVVNR